MQPQKMHWGAVSEGTIIREHATGTLWKVARANDTHVGLRTRSGDEKIIPRPHGLKPVTIMVLTDEELVSILTEKLGASPIHFEDHWTGALTCLPFEPMNRSDRKFHLEYMHGIVVGNAKEDKRRDLVALHDDAHARNERKGIPHVHLGWPEVEKHRRI